MHALDALAYTNPWRRRHPAEKALLALGLLACAVALPPWPGSVLVGAVALGVLLGPVALAPAQVWRAVRAPLVFIVVGSLPLLVAVGGATVLRWEPAGLVPATMLAGRALAALLCLVLFAATTPLADTLPRLERLGVPAAVTEIAALMYRLLFLLLDTVTTVREAQAGRLGFRTWRTTYRSVAGQAGAVFIGSFDRARRLEQGLALRGYTGSLKVQVEARPVSWPFLAVTTVLLVAVVAATLMPA
ncbi:cobalt ECF transporter T component CbiQ [Pseudonocardia sp.]|jgi:cobalt/nickel transport system permease protein|uniref:cobalt ECF transporter T component CbiQ n=1 Tax=Pseudonocardia sp. TaxID=60912 RepID=UPI0026086E52|nr:cobalt ECF transporter T component CbiQ [Pseudonocardia sp.]MCW2722243.1 Cobalt transporter component CbiQ [Pseudonocardia sp.]MDT7614965.1 cobalt/nickel transport system permease protein [Pseudonocardiales bacterium]